MAVVSASHAIGRLSAGYAGINEAALAQLGERQTEDLKVPGSIPGGGIFGYPLHLSLCSLLRPSKRSVRLAVGSSEDQFFIS